MVTQTRLDRDAVAFDEDKVLAGNCGHCGEQLEFLEAIDEGFRGSRAACRCGHYYVENGKGDVEGYDEDDTRVL